MDERQCKMSMVCDEGYESEESIDKLEQPNI